MSNDPIDNREIVPAARFRSHGAEDETKNLSVRIDDTSAYATSVDQANSVLMAETDAYLSTRIDTLSQALSVLSQALSVTSNALSALSLAHLGSGYRAGAECHRSLLQPGGVRLHCPLYRRHDLWGARWGLFGWPLPCQRRCHPATHGQNQRSGEPN